MAKVRVGIIGAGQIGNWHMKQYAGIPDAEMVAVCDIRPEAMEQAVAQYNIPHTMADYRDLLARDDIDAVDVCLHNRLHMPVTVAALEAGKHVYCEKPMSWTYGEALAMHQAMERSGKKLHIQLSTIFQPETRAAKRLIEGGYLGRLYYAKCYTYRRRNRPFVDGYGTAQFVNTATSGGGTLLDMAIYSLGRMLYLLDLGGASLDVQAISGAAYQETGMYEDRRQSSGYDVEELGIGLVRLASRQTLFLESAWALHSGAPEGDTLMGAQGGVRLDPFAYYTTLADMEMDGTFDLKTADWRWHQVDPAMAGYDDSQKHWVWALLGRVPLIDTARYALAASLISDGVYLSNQLGREVTAAEVAAAKPGMGRF